MLNALIGEYRILESLGVGGMGEVYKAVHTHLGRVIAIKVLSPDLADGPALRRFYSEAGIQASLKHCGVAEYLGFYEYQGRPCILMEYVDGETVASLVRRRGALPVADAVHILREIAEVVANFHAQGVVHRDLKSNNVKINSAGRVKVLDFGIARMERSDRLTRAGAVIGTPSALAPEQVRGEAATAATDVWQIGVLTYELLTGRLPFNGGTAHEMFAQILAAQFPSVAALRPAVPAAVEKIIARCLQKEPSRRYPSALELYSALADWEAAAAVSQAPAPRPLHSHRFLPAGRRRLVQVLLGAAAAAILLALGLILPVHVTNHPPPRPEPVAVAAAAPDLKTVTVDTMDGTAQVYRAGALVGATPYRVQAHTGEKIELVLRREGCKDLVLQFEPTERHSYTYTMEPLKGH
jgi:eukaryotic-like serine/threonine-protein kinase